MEDQNNKPESKHQNLSKVYSFFCWCSGARLYLLKQCPTEYNKYFGIGAIVVFTGLLATFTGGYAFYTIFENPVIALLLGVFWGAIIFFLDWYIVSSLRKENNIGKELLSALPRLILSLILAVVISKPLELRLFQNEILKEIEVLKRDSEINYQDLVFEEFDEIKQLETENKILTSHITDKEKLRSELFALLIAEAEGRSPTNKAGKGSVYKEKKSEYDLVSEEINKLRENTEPKLNNNIERINNLKKIRDEKIAKGYAVTENYNGFLARLEALGALTERNKYISMANVFLVLLFILLESSPVLVKLMSKRGPYDVLLDSEELLKTYDTEHQILKLNNALYNEVEKKKQNKRKNKEAREKVLEHYYAELIEAGKQINLKKINKWKEIESDKINENFDEESSLISNALKS